MATIVLPIIDVVRIRAQTMVLQMSAIVLSMKLQGREVLVPFSFLICVSVFMLKRHVAWQFVTGNTGVK